MKYKVVTVGREYGSGGSLIAQRVAQRLGWKLLDNSLVLQIAEAARIDPSLARQLDERIDSWGHRVARGALWHGVFEGVASVSGAEFADADTLAALAKSLIREAYEQGNCVVVGRGAQCVLQAEPDVFHVFVYAPRAQKAERLRGRVPQEKDLDALMVETDRQRAEYVRRHFDCDWTNPHLYHLMVTSEMGEDAAADIILRAMEVS